MSWNVRQTLLFDGGSKLKTSFSFIHQVFNSPSHFNQEKSYFKERTLTVFLFFFSTNVVTEQASKMRRGCFYVTVYLSLSLPNNNIHKKKETSYVLFLPQRCSGYCSNLENERIRREIISNFRPFSGVKCC